MSASTDEGTPLHLTTKELAKRWRTTTNAIYTARSKGYRLPDGSFKRGTSILWPLASVEEHERESRQRDPNSNPDLRLASAPVEPTRRRRAGASRSQASSAA